MRTISVHKRAEQLSAELKAKELSIDGDSADEKFHDRQSTVGQA